MMSIPLGDTSFLEDYNATGLPRLLIFDYDGTLTPIVAHPATATLSPQVAEDLRALAQEPQNEVWIVSGRDQAWLQSIFDKPGDGEDPYDSRSGSVFGLCAEHGAFMKLPYTYKWTDCSTNEDLTWMGDVEEIFRQLVVLFEGSHVEIKKAAIAWHYRQAEDAELAESYSGDSAEMLRDRLGRKWDVEVVQGKCVIEVRASSLGKGPAVQKLVGDEARWGFVACFGDDRTDEGEKPYQMTEVTGIC